MCHADFLFLMTDVDCLFTANPRSNPDAQMVKVVYDIDGVRKLVSTSTLGSSLGTGGMETKLIAAELATAAGVATIICNGTKPENIGSIIKDSQNKPVNTTETVAALLGPPIVADQGEIYRDLHDFYTAFAVAQAVTILVPRQFLTRPTPSLVDSTANDGQPLDKPAGLPLPTSSTSPVSDASDELVPVGRGLVNYNSSDMSKLKGLHSSEIESTLGHIDSEHVIESIVLFKPSSPPHSSALNP
ncbi:hypothetical protein Pst134EA_027140 [Puccinia striiformis f. sp. tritici]|uniref:hypothetical protein n=1 Tax=Puccinia striiformis f. sp. tritici TaxID=168172 RepID=UPI002007F8D2|nr:hypothetical protein Pst134EA_027140 [Puccinia striiformis f. sp. tritici]KAH9450443.1 hypothetical protein Pst134EA_027140 [Puccinia striiformis f. sp. tritici]